MYLKALQMQGFKSFPDKINIDFGAGITAIVGPNGSGKSNIVDAIRWVLGEQSTKTLRGAKMEDVIFGGTALRKQVGFAEVSLTLDNSEGDLATPYAEVTVTRRYYRSGESEYYINKTPCRLKDIHELFMNTGLGRDGYSMIGQGKIAEVLSVRSEDRRAIFEEAAGISKYRYRKTESERKLAATEENLVRLRDIMSELDERIGPLKSQSEKARRYLDLREERRGLEIDVWLDSVSRTNDQLSKIADDSAALALQLAAAESEIEAGERRIDAVFEETRNKNVEIDQLQQRIRETQEQNSALFGERAVVENDISHAESRIAEIRRSMEEVGAQNGDFDAQRAEREAEILKWREAGHAAEAEIAALSESSRAAADADAGFADEAAALSSEIARAAAGQTDCRIEMTSIDTALAEAETRKLSGQDERAEREAQREETIGALKAARARREEHEEVITSNGNIVIGYEKKETAKKAALAERTAELAKWEETIREKSGRANLLSDMERHLEGFGYAVKKVMEARGRGALKGIHGPLSSLIQTPDEYAVAVEIALGGALQHIVTDDEDGAKAAIRMLKSERAGRATFLPLTSVRGTRLAERGLEQEDGFVGIAADLITCEERYRPLVLSACGRCAVCEHIDAAVRIAKKYGYKFKIVTLDGQVVNAGGSMTGGSLSKNTGVLTRKNEIERLRREIETAQRERAAAEAACKKQQAELSAVEAALAGARAEVANAGEALLVIDGEIGRHEVYLRSIEERIAALDREQEEQALRRAESLARREELARALAEQSERLAALEEKLALVTGDRERAAKQREALSEQLSALKYRLADIEKDTALAQAAIEQIEQRRALFAQEQEARAADILRLEEEIVRLAERRDGIDARRQEAETGIAAMQQRIAQAGRERDEIERSMTDLRQQNKDKTAEKERLIKEQMRLESKKAAVQSEYDTVVGKLWDEYELTISKARELQRPLGDRRAAERRIAELRAAMKALGNVNVDSIEEYKIVKERHTFYTEQIGDLERSKGELVRIIDDLTEMMRSLFKQQFDVINAKFSEVFRELFGGGSAHLELTDPSDVLTSGIEIQVTPPGKVIKSLQLLSGGEQTFVAIALYFAILAVKPVPFCILDEIEAALDDVNVTRFANYLRRYCDKTQFIVVTHRRGTMEEADVLYGVTMQEKGVSKLLTINVSEIERQLNLKVH